MLTLFPRVLTAQIGDKLSRGLGASRFYVFMPAAYPLDGLREVLPRLFPVGVQGIVRRGSRMLATPLGVFLKLGLALRFLRGPCS
jgi:hypothetical protein